MDFKRGGWLWISSLALLARSHSIEFSIEIGLTLDKTRHGEPRTRSST